MSARSLAPLLTVDASPRIEFCGIDTAITDLPFTIGRDGDLVVDDENRYLHRHFLTIDRRDGVWMLANSGTQLSASVSDHGGRVAAHLAPGGVFPIVSPSTTVRFTAGPTTYELSVHVPGLAFSPPALSRDTSRAADADATEGRAALSPEQLLVVLVLAEPVLRAGRLVASTLPANAEAASRLGWTVTKFNRKLDSLCSKLAERGVRGLRGGPDRLAIGRRARLVEYAIGAQLVTPADLSLLPAGRRPVGAPSRAGRWAATGGWVRSR
jgi:hypothetical protein